MDGSIKFKERDGVKAYQVRRPHKDEEVHGYTNFSSIGRHMTETEQARVE